MKHLVWVSIMLLNLAFETEHTTTKDTCLPGDRQAKGTKGRENHVEIRSLF